MPKGAISGKKRNSPTTVSGNPQQFSKINSRSPATSELVIERTSDERQTGDGGEVIEIKKTQRSVVQRLGSGHYRKSYLWDDAKTRFTNEVAVLLHLEQAGCDFVPRLITACAGSLIITTTDCGLPVQRLPDRKIKDLYAKLEDFGVRHQDAELRNIVYDPHLAEFAIIDFEFAQILDTNKTTDSILQELFDVGFEAQLATQAKDSSLELPNSNVSIPGLRGLA